MINNETANKLEFEWRSWDKSPEFCILMSYKSNGCLQRQILKLSCESDYIQSEWYVRLTSFNHDITDSEGSEFEI